MGSAQLGGSAVTNQTPQGGNPLKPHPSGGCGAVWVQAEIYGDTAAPLFISLIYRNPMGCSVLSVLTLLSSAKAFHKCSDWTDQYEYP
ncbi:hypothetical protein SKAU_G00254610 [Synaphobranchus kaupii]|uniref:Uncharacterized protein n=1 Tax=Synaphobranchus kaupii TaxID=118154 RepID=A0A9Q1IRA2_SYNKA|nr:hypothetical protein SKAU_G00254610 [Synaphobranchus kaupii]